MLTKKPKSVSVIGSGIVGLATALMLKESGHSVQIFEKNSSFGLETSFANGGLFSTASVPLINRNSVIDTIQKIATFQPTAIKFDFSEVWKNKKQLYKWTRDALDQKNAEIYSEKLSRLTIENLKILELLMEKYKMDFEVRKNGTLYIYDSKETLDSTFQNLQKKQSLGVQVKFLTKEECVKLEDSLSSVEFYGGILSSRDWTGDTFLLCREIERILKSQNVNIQYNSNVKKIIKNEMFLENGDVISSDEIVICTGINLNLIENKHPKFHIIPIKGYSVTLEIDQKDVHKIPKLPIFNAKERVVLTPFNNRIRISGVAQFSGLNTIITKDQEAKMMEILEKIFPTIKTMKILNRKLWCGFRSLSSTGCSITERIDDTTIVNFGHAHLGTSLAFSTAAEVCKII